ncbi:ABC transporter substrate-binding protein [Candidatus Lariskella endosymbiont of Hedychridium roseum]|uniref:ABC transporter substrate-binding protein n=1 Tax=Candidatus Lariskella endosymbiont of Hedychridium roseum TaxID=3077949 RepID=UPI0030D11D98
MKKVLTFAISIFFAMNTFAAENMKKVFINKLVEHPALNMTIEGIIDGLEQNGYERGVNLDLRVESAQANPALASQIAAKFVGKGADVVVGVATISAQSFAKYAKENKIKLVFSSVIDPIKAELVQSLSEPGNNTSGVSNFVELKPQITLFQQIQPNLKRLGFLYNPSEINSLSLIEKLEELCHKLRITLVLQAANKTSEVAQASTKLAANVDAIFISNDSTALSALQTIINVATKVKIPVYVSDTDAVKLGALAALGPNQYEIGIQTAQIIARSLKGEDVGMIPVEFPASTELFLNEDIAQKIGMKLPNDIKAIATKIITKSK